MDPLHCIGPQPGAQRCAALLLCLALLPACGSKPPPEDSVAKSAAIAGAAAPAAALALTADEQAKLGLAKTAAQALRFTPEAEGYGLVLGHEALAQLVAELETARAAAGASAAALARAERLKATQGAYTAESEEATRRQAAADAAALHLAEQRLSAQFGQQPPWSGPGAAALLGELASGRIKLVRLTFPSGVSGSRPPATVQLARLDAAAGARPWSSSRVWTAPADSSIPGRSYFAALDAADAVEGERLRAGVAVGDAQSGVRVPAEALVISQGKSWCYVERPAGHFVRAVVDLARPVNGGYFVQGTIAPGDLLVVAGAGLLLARETSPGGEAE